MKEKHVYIIIPVYNREKLITACVNSVIQQTFSNWNAIIIDDGSSDRTSDILDEFAGKDERIIVVHQDNTGIAGARNRGIDEVFNRIADDKSGEYVGFLDSDDILEPYAFERVINTAVKHNADIVQWQANDFASDDEHPEEITNRAAALDAVEIVTDSKGALETILDTKGKGADKRFHLLWNNCRCVWTKMCAAHVYEGVRCPKGKAYEDDFIVDDLFLNAGKIVFINENLTNYRCHAGNFLKTTVLKDAFDHTECERNRFVHASSFEDDNLTSLAFHNVLMSTANSYASSVEKKCADKSIWKSLEEVAKGHEKSFARIDKVIFNGFRIAPRLMNKIYFLYRKRK